MKIKSKIPKGAEIAPADFAIVGRTGDLVFGKIFQHLFIAFLIERFPRVVYLLQRLVISYW